MSKIVRIVVHCTGEPDNVRRCKEDYRHWFFDVKKWRHYGYHAVVYQNGTWEKLQPLPDPVRDGGIITDATKACGQPGTNENSIHVAYVGGVDHVTKREIDTRTDAQKRTLWSLVAMWKREYGVNEVIGHRDWPGVRKSCPCFDAKKTYKNA